MNTMNLKNQKVVDSWGQEHDQKFKRDDVKFKKCAEYLTEAGKLLRELNMPFSLAADVDASSRMLQSFYLAEFPDVKY